MQARTLLLWLYFLEYPGPIRKAVMISPLRVHDDANAVPDIWGPCSFDAKTVSQGHQPVRRIRKIRAWLTSVHTPGMLQG